MISQDDEVEHTFATFRKPEFHNDMGLDLQLGNYRTVIQENRSDIPSRWVKNIHS
jgi:hypothetical protein